MKIIHITDTHICAPGQTIYGLNPNRRLETVIADVALRHADADLAVLTGDLTDRGDPESYEMLAMLVERLPMPVQLMLGNHDQRANFLARFPVFCNGDGFAHSYIDASGQIGRLLFLDTHEAGWSGGRLCGERLAWLEARLAEAGDRPATIFMHHPPLGIGVAHFDRICLAEPETFMSLIKGHRGGIRHIIIGHVHLPLNGSFPGGIPFTAGRGCSHQMVLDPLARDCKWAAGKPNYNVIVLDDANLFIHAFDLIADDLIGIGAFPPGP